MPKPPNIRVPGLTTKVGVPGGSRGVLLGRASARGPVQLLNDQQLRALGIKGSSNNQLAHQAGFTFGVTGLPTANEFIGQGAWSMPITFHSDDPNDVVTALSGATGTPSFRMLSASLALLGTIQFTTPTVGVVTWASDPYIHPAGALMLLYAPNPADASLGNINGRVVGYR